MNEIVLALTVMAQEQVLVSPVEAVCMAQNIYHEARGEPEKGQIAVAFVTLERVGAKGRPDSVCGVVGERTAQGSQFAWVSDAEIGKPSERALYEVSMQVAVAVMAGQVADPVPGATHFYAYNDASPDWARKFTQVAVIGNHRFMKE